MLKKEKLIRLKILMFQILQITTNKCKFARFLILYK